MNTLKFQHSLQGTGGEVRPVVSQLANGHEGRCSETKEDSIRRPDVLAVLKGDDPRCSEVREADRCNTKAEVWQPFSRDGDGRSSEVGSYISKVLIY